MDLDSGTYCYKVFPKLIWNKSEGYSIVWISRSWVQFPPWSKIYSLSLSEKVRNAVDQRWFLIHHSSHLQQCKASLDGYHTYIHATTRPVFLLNAINHSINQRIQKSIDHLNNPTINQPVSHWSSLFHLWPSLCCYELYLSIVCVSFE